MAVEDHPMWPEWSAAYDRMHAAKVALDALKHFPSHDPVRKAAEIDYLLALAAYHAASSKLE
jgi:hypothetical protein